MSFCIQRYWIEHAPQLEPLLNHESNWDVTGRIENVLEHLVIVPREANFGFAPRPQWDEVARREWGAYPWPDTMYASWNSALGRPTARSTKRSAFGLLARYRFTAWRRFSADSKAPSLD
jgi:hypothetical protein